MKSNWQVIKNTLATKIDIRLLGPLFQEYQGIEENYILRKWQYTQLNGGRLAEVAARIIYSIDSGVINLTKPVNECIDYIFNDKVKHNFSSRKVIQQVAKTIQLVYKFRSQRGAIHVSPEFTADEADSKCVLENVRWVMYELCRIFWTGDQKEIVPFLQEITRYTYPITRTFGEITLVQSTILTTEEEILVHLYFKNDHQISRKELYNNIPKDRSGITRSLQKLASSTHRQLVLARDMYLITDIGIHRVETAILNRIKGA